MKVPFIGVIGAGVLGFALAASAQSSSSSSATDKSSQNSASQSSTQTPSSSSSATSPSSSSSTTSPSSSSSATSPSSGSSATSSTSPSTPSSSAQASTSQDESKNELSGVVKKVDASKHSVKISSSTKGEQDLKLSPSATIMRDGSQISLDQLKEGDQVRASFDPTSNQATKIDVQSKSSDETKSKSDTSGKKY